VTAITTKAWPVALLKAAHLSSIRGEGVDDAPSEANFKTKASKQGPTGIGGRWIVIVTRKREGRWDNCPNGAGENADISRRD